MVYEISIQVLPTVPSPTTTHFIGRPDDIVFAEAFASKFLTPKKIEEVGSLFCDVGLLHWV